LLKVASPRAGSRLQRADRLSEVGSRATMVAHLPCHLCACFRRVFFTIVILSRHQRLAETGKARFAVRLSVRRSHARANAPAAWHCFRPVYTMASTKTRRDRRARGENAASVCLGPSVRGCAAFVKKFLMEVSCNVRKQKPSGAGKYYILGRSVFFDFGNR